MRTSGTLLYLSDRAVRGMMEDPEHFPEIFAPDSRVRFLGSEKHHLWIETAYDALTNAEWLLRETFASWNGGGLREKSAAKFFFERFFGFFVSDEDDLTIFGKSIVWGRGDDGFLHVLNGNNAAPSLFSYIAILYGHTYEGGGGLLTENI